MINSMSLITTYRLESDVAAHMHAVVHRLRLHHLPLPGFESLEVKMVEGERHD